MELITKVNITPLAERLTYKNKIMIIGSCFANEIGDLLKNYGFDISVNPFGTLYNPVSIVQSLERLSCGYSFEAGDVIDISKHNTNLQHNEPGNGAKNGSTEEQEHSRYCSFYHHSSFAQSSISDFLEYANARLLEELEYFKTADTIIITLGTSWVFRHIERNFIVSNCHKITPKEFVREFLQLDECVKLLGNFIKKHPNKRFIFTVSPIRHLKDGAHGNQISKATLLLAIEQLMQLYPSNCYYFPAYEIVLDELRDYRFYAEDMVHPSGVAVKYIFERFKENCIATSEYSKMQEMFKLHRQTSHRTLIT